MSKRPTVDFKALTSLTSDEAAPMAEAVQRIPAVEKPVGTVTTEPKKTEHKLTKELVSLSFKVPLAFHKDYCLSAAEHGMKLNEVLFESFQLWREKRAK